MQDIREAIRTKRQALQRLQEELAILERAVALLNGGEHVNLGPQVVLMGSAAQLAPKSGPRPKGSVVPGSQVHGALLVLRDAGTDLHIKEIVQRMQERGVKTNQASIVGTLARMTSEHRVFYRSKPNTFGLIEWKVPQLPLGEMAAR